MSMELPANNVLTRARTVPLLLALALPVLMLPGETALKTAFAELDSSMLEYQSAQLAPQPASLALMPLLVLPVMSPCSET